MLQPLPLPNHFDEEHRRREEGVSSVSVGQGSHLPTTDRMGPSKQHSGFVS